MQFDRAKLKAVILYACASCEPSQLGSVKLNKVLYFLDMIHYAVVGTPVTGATYRKRTFGPTCDQLLGTLAELIREKAVELRHVDYFGYCKSEYIAKIPPEKNRLSADEVSLLNEVLEFVCRQNTAKTISEFSHNTAWELADFGDILTYRSAFHLFPNEVSPEALEWGLTQAAEVEAERSQGNSLDYDSYSAFRKRVLEKGRAT
jgi:hypothetical protein